MRDDVPACPPRCDALDEQRAQSFRGAVHRGGESGRSAADDRHVVLRTRGLGLEPDAFRDLAKGRRCEVLAVGQADDGQGSVGRRQRVDDGLAVIEARRGARLAPPVRDVIARKEVAQLVTEWIGMPPDHRHRRAIGGDRQLLRHPDARGHRAEDGAVELRAVAEQVVELCPVEAHQPRVLRRLEARDGRGAEEEWYLAEEVARLVCVHLLIRSGHALEHGERAVEHDIERGGLAFVQDPLVLVHTQVGGGRGDGVALVFGKRGKGWNGCQ